MRPLEFDEEPASYLSLQHAGPARCESTTGATHCEEDAMNRLPAHGEFNRRSFCAVTGVVALAALAVHRRRSSDAENSENATGPISRPATVNGRIRCVPGWGQMPTGLTFGGTHGAIATDNAGQVYVSTQSETGILIYAPRVHSRKISRLNIPRSTQSSTRRKARTSTSTQPCRRGRRKRIGYSSK